MKKINKKYKILIIVITLILSLTLLSFTLKDRILTPPEKIIKDAGLLIQNMIYKPVYFIEEKITDITKEQTDKTDKMLIEEQKNTIEELKKLLDIKYTLEDYIEISSTVIKRNIDNLS